MFASVHQRIHRALLCLTLCWGSVSHGAQIVTLTGPTMGTTYTVKIDVPDAEFPMLELDAAIQHRLQQIDQRMSTYRADSDVTRFNQSPAGDWFAVDQETARVVHLAQSISRATHGAFDITVGPAVQLWNFGALATGQFALPSDDQVEITRTQVGYEKLQVRLDPPAVRKSLDEVRIDLSGIAKGYAVDAVAALLDDQSLTSYMVEIGGEVRVGRSKSDASPWRIGIEAPVEQERRVDCFVSLSEQAMASSGNYRSFFRHQGRMYSHTMDPRACRPVDHDLAAVAIVCDSCARADALATAILVMGPESGREWAEKHSVAALLTTRSNDQSLRYPTAGFPPITVPDGETASRGGANQSFSRIFTVTAVVFGLAVLAMSLGTILANRRLQGSCGGMAGLKDEQGQTLCDLCTKPSPDCSGPTESA